MSKQAPGGMLMVRLAVGFGMNSDSVSTASATFDDEVSGLGYAYRRNLKEECVAWLEEI